MNKISKWLITPQVQCALIVLFASAAFFSQNDWSRFFNVVLAIISAYRFANGLVLEIRKTNSTNEMVKDDSIDHAQIAHR